MGRDGIVEVLGGTVVHRLERRPLQPHEEQQYREDNRGGADADDPRDPVAASRRRVRRVGARHRRGSGHA
jgi:hypothetical protein